MSTEREKELIEELKEINKKQEKRVNKLESKITEDINRYFLVQGVILSSISSLNFRCHRWWIPFSLSLLAGVLNLFHLYNNTREFLKCSDELDKNMADLHDLKMRSLASTTQADQRAQTQTQAQAHNQQELNANVQLESMSKPDPVLQWKRLVLYYFLNVGICLVSVFFICAGCFLNRCKVKH